MEIEKIFTTLPFIIFPLVITFLVYHYRRRKKKLAAIAENVDSTSKCTFCGG
jgi:preprotein translocase subunit YajC